MRIRWPASIAGARRPHTRVCRPAAVLDTRLRVQDHLTGEATGTPEALRTPSRARCMAGKRVSLRCLRQLIKVPRGQQTGPGRLPQNLPGAAAGAAPGGDR